ncbi:LPS export ABC transporter ATP-binding protein [Pseudorhodoplanes sp.]|uniref:LPS export ABC transporter ATP-binding protein n=1 Tax=Pseudorhodoplanes sp. TaxID=1934341 RepID=UPI003D15055A
MFDFLSIFRRRRPGKPRKRKSTGTWRVELEKIGGLVGKSADAKPAPGTKPAAGSKSPPRRGALAPPPVLQPPLPDALKIEPLRDEFLVSDPGRQNPLWQHPLHPETLRSSPSRRAAPGREARHASAAAQTEAPPRAAEPRFVPPRPRRQGPAQNPAQVPHGYLAAHSVEKSFGARKVVRGASLFVRRGEAVGLLGPNGAGKTTIFYMITGLIKADKGKIELDGNDVTPLPMYQRARLGIGYLPQEASIFRGLNVEENIRSVLEVVEPDAKRRARDLDALLEEFNIGRLRKSPSIALSGGERRRVEIARALASRPSYMLLDEPFAGIDPIAVGDIQALVRHLTYRGIGVLITDHNVRETLGLTDRAYIIYSGEVLMEGRAEDIVNNPDVRRLYLGEEFRL